MSDFDTVDQFSKILAHLLDEDLDEATPDRARVLRLASYQLVLGQFTVADTAVGQIVESLDRLMISQSVPKSAVRGLQEARDRIATTRRMVQFEREKKYSFPDVLPAELAQEDPFIDLPAGEPNPYRDDMSGFVPCGALHRKGWNCVRPAHPAHWKHWDDDAGVDLGEEIDGQIIATWRTATGDDQLHPMIEEIQRELDDADDYDEQ
jgi:hypothetical protein